MRLKMMGGGDSTDYDALTAIAEKVVEGLIFLGVGSDEQQVGTLPDMEQMRDSPGYSSDEPESPIHNAAGVAVTKDTNGDNRIALIPPWGRYPGDETAWVGCYPADIGIVAAAVAVGQTIAGIEGAYGSDGNLAAKDLRAGKIGYGANGRVAGSATDYGAVSETIGAGESYTINAGIYSAGKVTAKTLASQTSATATAAYILSGYTAYVNGSKVTGTMENIAAINTAKSAVRSTGGTSGSGLYIRMDAGAHITNASSGYPEVYLSDSATRTAAGLTAALLAYGETCLGLTGTYKGKGTATPARVLSGYTFSSASYSEASGTMTDNSGTSKSASASLDTTNSRLQMTIPSSGYYTTSSKLYAAYSTISDLIGLTAAKLAYGKTCLGLTGTYKPTVTQISAIAACGFHLTDQQSLGEEDSYTCTAAGTCYYNGFAASYYAAATVTCEIYKNGTLVDSRNINSDNAYNWRGTMQEKSFSVAKGDVVKVVAAVTYDSATYSKMAHIDATIVTYT